MNSVSSNCCENSEENKNHQQPEEENVLHKTISLWNGMSIVLSTMIGVGIFMSPQDIVTSVPSVVFSLMMWFTCGLIAIGASLTYVELGLMFPQSGGEYVYLYKSLPKFISFSYIWCSILVLKPTSAAILIQFFSETIVKMFFLDCHSIPLDSARYLASAVTLMMTMMNIYRFNWSLRINNFLTFAKFFALGSMIIFGFIHLGRGITQNLYLTPPSTTISVTSLGIAFYNGMWSFDGWNQLNYMSGEMKHPQRDLPLVLITSTSIITVVYVLVNFSYLVLLGMPNILLSKAVAYDAGSLYLGKGALIVSIFVALSAFGAGNATLFCGGRIFYEAALNGQLPLVLAALHRKHRTMLSSLLVQGFLTIMYLLFVGDISVYLVYFSGAVWFFYLMAFLATILLRFTMPDHPRPFKPPIIIPILMCFVAITIIILGFINFWFESVISVVGVLSASLPYVLFVRSGSVFPDGFNQFFERVFTKISDASDLFFPKSESEIISG